MAYQNYLPIMQSDYFDEIVSLRSTGSINFSFEKKQKIFQSDGGHKEVVSQSNNWNVFISVNFNNLSQSVKNTFFDIFANIYKANGLQKSFLFSHNNENFICKFSNNVQESMSRNMRHSYSSFDLLAIGIDNNLINTNTWVVGSLPLSEYIENTNLESVVLGGELTLINGEEAVW